MVQSDVPGFPAASIVTAEFAAASSFSSGFRIMSFGKPPVERRAFGRRQAEEHAIVRVAGRPLQRCVIRNISEGGALLDFGEPVWLPFSFRLQWEGTKREETCETRHQNGGRVGVLFVAKKAAEAGNELLRINDVAPWIAESNHPRR